jgi:CheY-like chemotaxis protein
MALILIIDDDPMVRTALAMALQAAGHRVMEAADGQAGLAVFQAHGADVVVTDILMPRKEGIETIRELRLAAPDLRIVAMSASPTHSGPDWLRVASQLGADATLTKPFTARELLAAAKLDAAPCKPAAPEPAKPQDRVRSILLVDDDEEVLAYVSDLLTDHGYEVIPAASPATALAIIGAGRKIDLLLTDVRMPGSLDGFALARAAKAQLPDLGVVYVSGWIETLPALDDYVLGPLLTKPFRTEMLVRAIEQSLPPL